MRDFRATVKALIPDPALNVLYGLGIRGKYGYAGNYKSWEAALDDSTGYDAPQILERVKDAALKVKSGEAAFERDSIPYGRIDYSWPVLAGILRAATGREGCLGILDFGGSLGSSYYQNRKFLSTLRRLRWCVVEQPSFVEVGRALFQNEGLAFYSDIFECMEHEDLNAVLISGVLQYLRNPHGTLDDILSLGIENIILDRTPFSLTADHDLLTLQTTPPCMYTASFPHWFFEKSRFRTHFSDNNYSLVAEFEGFDKANIKNSRYSGFIFSKQDNGRKGILQYAGKRPSET